MCFYFNVRRLGQLVLYLSTGRVEACTVHPEHCLYGRVLKCAFHSVHVCMHVFSAVSKCTFRQRASLSSTSISPSAWCLLLSMCMSVCHVHSAVHSWPRVSTLNTSLREPAILSLFPPVLFLSYVCADFFFFFFFCFSHLCSCHVPVPVHQ